MIICCISVLIDYSFLNTTTSKPLHKTVIVLSQLKQLICNTVFLSSFGLFSCVKVEIVSKEFGYLNLYSAPIDVASNDITLEPQKGFV